MGTQRRRATKVPAIMLRSEAATALGVTVEGLRHLEKMGHIEVQQTVGGRPFYLAADVERVRKSRAKAGR